MFNGSSWKKWVLPSSVLVDGAWVGFYSKVEILSSRFRCLLLQAAQSWGKFNLPQNRILSVAAGMAEEVHCAFNIALAVPLIGSVSSETVMFLIPGHISACIKAKLGTDSLHPVHQLSS